MDVDALRIEINSMYLYVVLLSSGVEAGGEVETCTHPHHAPCVDCRNCMAIRNFRGNSLEKNPWMDF